MKAFILSCEIIEKKDKVTKKPTGELITLLNFLTDDGKQLKHSTAFDLTVEQANDLRSQIRGMQIAEAEIQFETQMKWGRPQSVMTNIDVIGPASINDAERHEKHSILK